MSDSKPMIYAKLVEVARAVGAVPKSGRNQQQNYAFRGIVDLIDSVHGPMCAAGVVVLPEVIGEPRYERVPTRSGGEQFHAVIQYRHTFYAEDGSSVSCVTVGEALDSSDKAANKAHSFALKYALNEVFMVAYDIEEGDAESPEVGTTIKSADILPEPDYDRTAVAVTAAPPSVAPPPPGAAAPAAAPPDDDDFSGGDPLIDTNDYHDLIAAIEETAAWIGRPREKLQMEICTKYRIANLQALTCTQLGEISKRLAAMQAKPAPAGARTCPKCGKTLVRKNGKNGEFLACPGYPDCKHTENV